MQISLRACVAWLRSLVVASPLLVVTVHLLDNNSCSLKHLQSMALKRKHVSGLRLRAKAITTTELPSILVATYNLRTRLRRSTGSCFRCHTRHGTSNRLVYALILTRTQRHPMTTWVT